MICVGQRVDAQGVSGARILADHYHDKVAAGQGALAYEFCKSKGLVLGLAGLRIPRKEMENKPNTVHVVTGRGIWSTAFDYTAAEVQLTPETLSPVRGDQPFPGFNEDGVIVVGHLPPTKTGLGVFWMTMYKIAHQPNGHKPL